MHEYQVERLGPHEQSRWDTLAVDTGSSPFSRPGWVNAWVRAFTDQPELQAVTVRRDGVLVGILPVMRGRGSLVSAANLETPRVGAVVADKIAAEHLALGVVRSGFRRVDLTFLPEDDPLTLALRAIERSQQTRILWQGVRHQPFIDVRGTASEYEERRLSTRRRRDL